MEGFASRKSPEATSQIAQAKFQMGDKRIHKVRICPIVDILIYQ
jgi:hypothetical protein